MNGLNFSTSEHTEHLMAAIAKVQEQVGVIEKTAANPHFKSTYAPLDAIWRAATKACHGAGLVVVQPATGNGVWTYIQHVESGEWMSSFMELPLAGPPSKDKDGNYRPGPVTPVVIGSITSYARRYSYLCSLGLVAGEEDDDGTVSSGLESKAPSLQERKAIAFGKLWAWAEKTAGKPMTTALRYETLGDILGRPVDDFILKNESELSAIEDWVTTVEAQGALPLPANAHKGTKGK